MNPKQIGMFDGPYVHPIDMSDEHFDQWLGNIRRGIGGYDIQVLMGEGSGTPFDIYAKFLDMGEPIEVTAPMRRGRALEDDALTLFADVTGFVVKPLKGDAMFVRHPENKFLVAQVDGIVVANGKVMPLEMGDGIVDAKVPANFTFGSYVTDGITAGNYLQVQWQMGLMGIKWATFAVLDYENWRTLGGETPPIIEFDPVLFDTMRERAETFLNDHIFTRTPPPEDEAATKDFKVPVVGNEESKVTKKGHLAKLIRFFEVREQKATAEYEEKLLREQIEKMFDEYDTETLVLAGGVKIHWKHGKQRRFNQKRALAALKRHGEDTEEFYDVKPTRPFKPVGG